MNQGYLLLMCAHVLCHVYATSIATGRFHLVIRSVSHCDLLLRGEA